MNKVDQLMYNKVVDFVKDFSQDLDAWSSKTIISQDLKGVRKFMHIRVGEGCEHLFGTKKQLFGRCSQYGGATVVWDNYRIAVAICSGNEVFNKEEGRKRALERLESLYKASVVLNREGHVNQQYLVSLPEIKYPNSHFEAAMLDYILRNIVPKITLEQYDKNVRRRYG